MQVEATDSSLREGIAILAVKDTDLPLASEGKEEKDVNKEQQDPEALAATEKEDNTPTIKEEQDADMEAVDGESHHNDTQTRSEKAGEEVRQTSEVGDEWEIPYSDEEMGDPKSWIPSPPEIKRLYEILSKGEMLELNFVPLPRRPPTPEHTESPERDDEDAMAKEREREERVRKPPTPTEFDFDEEQMQATPKNTFVNRRRTPGSSARSSVKREARLDKVLSDMKRHRKIEEQIMRSSRDLFKCDKKIGGNLSPNSQKEREKERERDSNPNTIFSPRQRRY